VYRFFHCVDVFVSSISVMLLLLLLVLVFVLAVVFGVVVLEDRRD